MCKNMTTFTRKTGFLYHARNGNITKRILNCSLHAELRQKRTVPLVTKGRHRRSIMMSVGAEAKAQAINMSHSPVVKFLAPRNCAVLDDRLHLTTARTFTVAGWCCCLPSSCCWCWRQIIVVGCCGRRWRNRSGGRMRETLTNVAQSCGSRCSSDWCRQCWRTRRRQSNRGSWRMNWAQNIFLGQTAQQFAQILATTAQIRWRWVRWRRYIRCGHRCV